MIYDVNTIISLVRHHNIDIKIKKMCDCRFLYKIDTTTMFIGDIMRLCPHCHSHNRKKDHHCHECGTVLKNQSTIPWKTAILLGVAVTGCIDKNVGEPEYGVAMLDADLDGFYEYSDCDDADPEVGDPEYWYADVDGDGYGDPDSSFAECDQPEGYVDNDGDCDDSDATINPDIEEMPDDGIDSNCDGNDNP